MYLNLKLFLRTLKWVLVTSDVMDAGKMDAVVAAAEVAVVVENIVIIIEEVVPEAVMIVTGVEMVVETVAEITEVIIAMTIAAIIVLSLKLEVAKKDEVAIHVLE